MVNGTFHLTDHNDRKVNTETFRGSFVLVFFGFTHCQVVCPRALTKLSAALDAIGDAPIPVTGLYITVDPARDSPQVMRDFLRSYPRFLGLTGSQTEIENAKRSFRVFATRSASSLDDGGYDVPHTAFTYLLDPAGQFIAHFGDAISLSELVERLRRCFISSSATGKTINDRLPAHGGC
ncbi:SCO family protein [Tardiphaga robiniae]|nr:SCO family protein [Tardiphaga robiniae]